MNFRRPLIFAFTIFSLLCASCSDLAQDASLLGLTGSGGNSGGIGETAAAQKYASVTGTAFASGAFPEEIAARVSGTAGGAKAKGGAEISKSAFPQMAGADLQGFAYKFTAVKVGDESVYYEAAQDDISVSAEGLVSFGVNIPVLDAAVQYKIVCEAYLDAAMTKPVLKGESQKFEIGRESQTASASVPLGAIQESGCMGSVELLVALESGAESAIDSASMTISGLSPITGTLSGSEYKFSSDANAVPCGAHLARFSFKKGSQEVYAFTQIVNVYQNLETKTWVQNGAEPYFNTTVGADGKKTTTCALTAAMLESWTLTEFFVDASRSDDPTNANYSTQSGTFINPCLTFDGAVSKLVDPNKDYTIYINGTVTGAQAVPSGIQARSLTISGANGLYTSGPNAGQPKDTLDADGIGSALCVQTTVPVSIKDLRITGADDDGVSGLLIQEPGVDVTLLGGTLITGNQADNGGGVYISAGSLAIKGAVISGNAATAEGGGIYNDGGSVTFYFGSIESNSALFYGGGVYNKSGSFEMKDGASIKQNQTVASDGSICDGGGVYIEDGSFTMSGGTISDNNTKGRGGAVFAQDGSFVATGGTISQNSANTNGGAVFVFGGAFIVSGSVSIPYGTGNDVFLDSDQTISIAGALTATAPVATITPHEYVDGTPILSLAEPSSTTIGAERAKFSIKQQSEQLEIFDISNTGYLTTVMFSFDETFTNGTVYGTETYEGKKYAVIKYRYTQYNNLFMNVTNPYADIGWDMEFKLDDVTTDPASATTLADGYHTLSATLTKGSESVTATTRVHAMIKPVTVTVPKVKGFITRGDGYRISLDVELYIQGLNGEEYTEKQTIAHWTGVFTNDLNGEYSTNSTNSVILTSPDSTFYFFTSDSYDAWLPASIGKINRGFANTTRTLRNLKNNGRSFDSGCVNSDGNSCGDSGRRSHYWFTVTLNDD